MKKGEKIFNVFNIAFITFFSIIIIFPIVNIIALSFNDGMDSMKGGIYFWPRMFTLDNYRIILSDKTVFRAFFVSAMRVLIGVASHLFVTGIAAYAMSKPSLMGRSIFIKMGIITMFFSGGMIPSFLLINSLGLYNTFWVFIIPVMFSFYDMIIFMNFFRNLPASLEEAARIDGAGVFKVFFKIIVPLSMPVFATIALFHGVFQWNDYFTAKLYIQLAFIPNSILFIFDADQRRKSRCLKSGCPHSDAGHAASGNGYYDLAHRMYLSLPAKILYQRYAGRRG